MFNILNIAFARESAFESFLNENGKKRNTTFYSDFTIAELCDSINGVKDTYKRAIASWKDDVEYMAELVVVLNHKIWEHYEKNELLTRGYDSLWRKAHEYCQNHFKGKDLSFYYNYID